MQARRVELQRQRLDQILIGAEVGFVDRARDADQIAEVRARALAISRKAFGGAPVFPSAAASDPSRRGEMMERDDRRDLVLVAASQNATVMVERSDGEVAGLGLDAGPLDRKAVRVEAEPREHRDILGVAMILVARVAGRLDEWRSRSVLQQPEVRVYVVALDLMRGGCGSPKKIAWKCETVTGHRISSPAMKYADATRKTAPLPTAYFKIAAEM